MAGYQQLERKYGHLGIPNLIRILAIFRLLTWILALASGEVFVQALQFDRSLIFQGEVWRILSFVLAPLSSSPIFILIEVLFMFMISDGMEQAWGSFGVTCFVFATVLLQAIGGVILPFIHPYPGGFVFPSLIVAFACIYPLHEIMLFFVIPVKMKYIGMIIVGSMLLLVLAAPIMAFTVALAFLPLIVVFVPRLAKSSQQRAEVAARRSRFESKKRDDSVPFHQCDECQTTEADNPDLEFRISADGRELCSNCRKMVTKENA